MKIGILSDAHGNTLCLEKCIDHLLPKVDKIFFLGDIYGYFPDSSGNIKLLKKYNIHCILGNHDFKALKDHKEKIKLLKDDDFNFINSLSTHHILTYKNIKVIMVHGSPTDYLNEYVHPNSDFNKWRGVPYDIILMGHTHRSFIKKIEGKYFINVGSCGLPRDIGNLFTMGIINLEKRHYKIEKIEVNIEDIINTYPQIENNVITCLYRK
tara:strand:+ start:109 stop:738 length:630 start_codon:yes stop_codon:yes gene_type:complete